MTWTWTLRSLSIGSLWVLATGCALNSEGDLLFENPSGGGAGAAGAAGASAGGSGGSADALSETRSDTNPGTDSQPDGGSQDVSADGPVDGEVDAPSEPMSEAGADGAGADAADAGPDAARDAALDVQDAGTDAGSDVWDATSDIGADVPADVVDAPVDVAGDGVDGSLPCAEPGALTLNGHCYFMFTAPNGYTWSEAVQACGTHSAHLANITSFVLSNSLGQIVGQCWIGLHWQSPVGQWQWTTGDPLSWSQWAVGEPNGSGPCVRRTIDLQWRDTDCANRTAQNNPSPTFDPIQALCERP